MTAHLLLDIFYLPSASFSTQWHPTHKAPSILAKWPSEQAWIEELRSGSEVAFAAMVKTYQELVLNTCLGFVPRKEDAEDLTQEVFVEVYRTVDRFRGDAKLSTWLYRIAVNKCLEWIRYTKRQKRRAFFQSLLGADNDQALEVAGSIDHPGISLENRQRADVLYQAIDRLSENQRIAFTLHKVEGLSHQEISAVMELSVSSIESLIHRAKKKLQKLLYSYYHQQMI